jgi:Protein of unknown function (DUF4240)
MKHGATIAFHWLAAIALGVVVGSLLAVIALGGCARTPDSDDDSEAFRGSGAVAAPANPGADVTKSGQGLSTPAQNSRENAFWRLIAQARQAADGESDDVSHQLQDLLTGLPPQQIVAFDRLRHGLDRRAYTWDLWGAAYVIEDGCSQDCFRDFRAYLISLGRDSYEAALRDPDSLATVVQDAETGDWENAENVAPDAYASVTGDDYPLDDSDLSGSPRGTPWDAEDEDTLIARYPRLAARFR